MENDPLFQHADRTVSLDEERHIAVKRMYALNYQNYLPTEKVSIYYY